MKILGGLPSSGGSTIDLDISEKEKTNNEQVTSQNDNKTQGTQELTKGGEFLYNQIINNAEVITDTKAKTMISINEKNGEISPEDAKIIRNILGL